MVYIQIIVIQAENNRKLTRHTDDAERKAEPPDFFNPFRKPVVRRYEIANHEEDSVGEKMSPRVMPFKEVSKGGPDDNQGD